MSGLYIPLHKICNQNIWITNQDKPQNIHLGVLRKRHPAAVRKGCVVL